MNRPRAFTLIELLVVIAVIALLVGILLPALASARVAGKSTACLANIRSIGQALTSYEMDDRGIMPHWSGWQLWEGGTGTPGGTDAPGPGWMELVNGALSSPEAFADPARPREQVPFAYFLQSRYVFSRTGVAYTSLKPADVVFSSQFVLAGDCNQPTLFSQPYGASSNQPDCDQDDATQSAVFFAGQIVPHKGTNNLLFLDGHAGGYGVFDPAKMTWDAHRMTDWAGVM